MIKTGCCDFQVFWFLYFYKINSSRRELCESLNFDFLCQPIRSLFNHSAFSIQNAKS